MGMATPEPSRTKATITFEVTPADPNDGLTCMLCWGPRVDWHTVLKLGGRTVTAGLHECCIERAETKGGQGR